MIATPCAFTRPPPASCCRGLRARGPALLTAVAVLDAACLPSPRFPLFQKVTESNRPQPLRPLHLPAEDASSSPRGWAPRPSQRDTCPAAVRSMAPRADGRSPGLPAVWGACGVCAQLFCDVSFPARPRSAPRAPGGRAGRCRSPAKRFTPRCTCPPCRERGGRLRAARAGAAREVSVSRWVFSPKGRGRLRHWPPVPVGVLRGLSQRRPSCSLSICKRSVPVGAARPRAWAIVLGW